MKLNIQLKKAEYDSKIVILVAVSDTSPLDKIKKHAADVGGLENLRFWNYQSVIDTNDRL